MVKLFRKKSKSAETFKVEISLKLKNVPLEEYAHILKAYQISMLRFERLLKESLLEGYVSSTSLEKITQAFEFPSIRALKVPQFPSVERLLSKKETIEKRPVKSTRPVASVEPSPGLVQPRATPQSVVKPTATVTTGGVPGLDTSLTEKTPSEVIPSAVSSPKVPTTSTKKPTFTFSTSKSPSADQPVASSGNMSVSSRLVPEKPKVSFPSISIKSGSKVASPLGSTSKRSEEDRATGIAILRKQMLSELKKIRTVVSEVDQR